MAGSCGSVPSLMVGPCRDLFLIQAPYAQEQRKTTPRASGVRLPKNRWRFSAQNQISHQD